MTAAFPGDDHDREHGRAGDGLPDDEITRRFSDIVSDISSEMNWDIDEAGPDLLEPVDETDPEPADSGRTTDGPGTRLVPPAASDDPAERRRRRREQRKMERSEEVLAFKAEKARREAEYADDDEHFVPAEPPPLTWPKIRTIISTLILLGGFFLLLGPNLLSLGPNAVMFLSVAMILLGGSLLISGLRSHRGEPGEGWDDGSRV